MPGRVRTLVLTLIATAMLASPLVATDAASQHLVLPIAGRADGGFGTKWRTDLVVTNVSRRSVAVPVAIVFLRPNEPEEVLSITLEPRSTVILDDVIWRTFGLDSGAGMIEVIGLTAEAKLTARARIYNAGGRQGVFAQTVPAMPASKLARESFLSGLSGLGGKRTNIGIANPATEEAVVFLTLLEKSGEMRGGFSTVVPPRSARQYTDIFSYFTAGPLDGALVQINSSHPVYSYASIVEEESGDADFVAGSSTDTASADPITTPPCVNPAPLHLSPTPDKGWIVVFRPGTDATREATALGARYGFQPSSIFATLPGFHADISPSVVAAIRCDVTVAYVNQNGRFTPQ